MITEWGLDSARGIVPPFRVIDSPDFPETGGKLGEKWHVLQTRSRQEKVVAELMWEVGAAPFLPVVRRIMHYAHRRRTVEMPLFSSYVFMWGTLDHAYRAIASKGAVRLVPVADQARLSHELVQLRRAIRGEAAVSPYRFLERGVPVRVTSGPFKDLEGLVEQGVKNGRLVLQIRTLGRAASMEIDACLLERLDTPEPQRTPRRDLERRHRLSRFRN